MELSDIYKPIEKELLGTKSVISDTLRGDCFSEELSRYILNQEGKLIRPAAILFTSKISNDLIARVESPSLKIWQFAASVELIHTATLIHDDIIDNSLMRRFQPTINSRWGNELAILFGDYLFSKAFSILTEINLKGIHKLISSVTNRMSEGEFSQLNNRYNLRLNKNEYLFIIERKTAALFSACTEGASILISLSEAEKKNLYNFGLNVGMAFQIIDDVQDLIGFEHEIGKSASCDLKGGKITLPLIDLLGHIKDDEREIVKKIFHKDSKPSKKDILLLFELFKRYNSIIAVLSEAEIYLNNARSFLAGFDESTGKEGLDNLSNYLSDIILLKTSLATKYQT